MSRAAGILAVAVGVLAAGCAIKPVGDVVIERHMLYIDQRGDLRAPDEQGDVVPNFPNDDLRQEAEADVARAVEGKEKEQQKPSAAGAYLMRKDGKAFATLTCEDFTTAQKCYRSQPEQAACNAIENRHDAGQVDSKKVASPEEEYVIRMVAGFCEASANRKVDNITLFIHGGLNVPANAINRAYRLSDQMLSDRTYPIFVGWRAGPWSNAKAHYFFDRGGEYRPILGPTTFPLIVVEDILRSVGKTPRAIGTSIAQQFSVAEWFDSRDEEAYASKLADLVGGPKMPACESTVDATQVTSLLHICRRGSDAPMSFTDWLQIANPVKYVTAPFVEGAGTGIWKSLLRRTDLLLHRDAFYRGVGPSETALDKFLNALERLHPLPPITLIGHSMGAIVANNIVVSHPDLDFRNVVYMAAAASVKDVEFAITPLLRRNPRADFFSLSLDPDRELAEASVFGAAPSGSLLNWIDNYFNQVATFTDRTAGTWHNMIRAADSIFLPDVQERVHLTVFGVRDKRQKNYEAGPQTHGAFGEYRFWVPAFWMGREADKP